MFSIVLFLGGNKKQSSKAGLFNYSVLKATTGSFLAALLAGINPDIAVNKIDIKIIIPAVAGVKFAIPVTTPPDILAITIFATICIM